MFRTIRKAIPELTKVLGKGGEEELLEVLKEMERMLKKIPKQQTRKKNPTTRQLLQKKIEPATKKDTHHELNQTLKK
jgi:ubiquinone/menaquinone biosynthesis C-methylase UbiE